MASAKGFPKIFGLIGPVCLFFATVALAETVSQPAPEQTARSIVIATEGASPPFTFVDQKGEPQGFEIEIARSLCREMKANCNFVLHDWEGIVKGLVNKEYDAIVSSLGITEQRKKLIAFSNRYYLMPNAFIARKNSDLTGSTPELLAEHSIGATEKASHQEYLEQNYPKSEIHSYPQIYDAGLDLAMGRIDTVMGDKLSLQRFLESREGDCCQFLGNPVIGNVVHGKSVGVGLRKEDVTLKEAFDRALAAIIASGEYDRIREKYFPFDIK